MGALIGITTYGRREEKITSALYDGFYAVPVLYVEAVRRAGGQAVLIPPGGGVDLLDHLDGVVVTGGADIDPARYGGDQTHTALDQPDPERDESELSLMHALIQHPDLPALMICRGMQMLNVALGGDLHEHIPDAIGANLHQTPGTFWADHDVALAEGSVISGVAGTSKLRVRSGNHQAVRSLGQGLVATAWAGDGLVEALEYPDHRFCLGVQWHPETLAAQSPAHQGIFDALVRAATPARDAI